MTDVAVITGSSGAIGSAMVTAFREAGYFVVGIDEANAPEADASIRADLATLADSEEARTSLHRQLESAVGDYTLKVVVNNAAVQTLGAVEELTVAEFRRTLDINVTAPYALVKLCLDALSESRGCVINVGSIHARLTKPRFSAYATSKGALETLTRSLAVELGARVRVNAISPAAIDTPMLQAGLSESSVAIENLAAFHPGGQLGTPAEVARLALFLARDDLPFLNGAVLDLTGGIAGRLHDPI